MLQISTIKWKWILVYTKINQKNQIFTELKSFEKLVGSMPRYEAMYLCGTSWKSCELLAPKARNLSSIGKVCNSRCRLIIPARTDSVAFRKNLSKELDSSKSAFNPEKEIAFISESERHWMAYLEGFWKKKDSGTAHKSPAKVKATTCIFFSFSKNDIWIPDWIK